MSGSILTISLAYVLLTVLLLLMALRSRLPWLVKAAAIIVTSVFFTASFFALKSLLGFPSSDRLPPLFQVLWVRAVEPDLKTGNPGALYLWAEPLDENHVPTGLPRAFQLPYTPSTVSRALRARDQISEGNSQEGTTDVPGSEARDQESQQKEGAANKANQASGRNEDGRSDVDLTAVTGDVQNFEFRPLTPPTLPAKPAR